MVNVVELWIETLFNWNAVEQCFSSFCISVFENACIVSFGFELV